MLSSPTSKRFASMIFCGLAAAALFGLMQPLFHTPAVEFIHKWLGALGGTPLVAAFLVVGSIWAGNAGHDRMRGFLGLKNFHKFPPLWFAVAIAMLSLFLTDLFFQSMSATKTACGSVVWWFWDDLCQNRFEATAFFSMLVMLMAGFAFLTGKSQTTLLTTPTSDSLEEAAEKPIDLNELAQDVDKLIEWFENDDPITDPKQDAFGHGLVAKRIADRLAKLATKETDASKISTALIGPIGSGKSSIMRMVQENLRNRSKVKDAVVVIDISMWPYKTAEAAVQGIIKQITDELGKHINILGLRNTSRHYLRAIQATGSWVGALGHLMDGDDSPTKVVQKLNDSAKAIGLNIVIWIEDQERFVAPPGANDPERAKALQEGQRRLAPIHALMYEIDRCKHIGVVWADSTTGVQFDRHKVTRHSDLVPIPTIDQTWLLISVLREQYLLEAGRDYIDPALTDQRKQLPRRGDKPPTHHILSTLFDGDTRRIADCLCMLLDSPRRLKSALRLFREDWKLLKGEIDIDHLLALAILNSHDPHLSQFINDNILVLNGTLKRPTDPDLKGEEKDNPGHAMLYMLRGGLEFSTKIQRQAVAEVLLWIFPSGRSIDDSLPRPQGFGAKTSKSYWELAWFSKPDTAQLDQPILKDIRDWSQGKPNNLIVGMNDPSKAKAIQSFALSFELNDLPRLLDEILFAGPTRNLDAWFGNIYPAFQTFKEFGSALWLPEDEVQNVVLNYLPSLVPANLYMAQALACIFRATSVSDRILPDEARSKIRETFISELTKSFGKGHHRELVEALRGEPHDLLVKSLIEAKGEDTNDFLVEPFKEWPEFAISLVAATQRDPSVMLPQIAVLLESHGRTSSGDTMVGLGKHAPILFNPEQLQALMEMFRDSSKPPNLVGEARAAYRGIAAEARAWKADSTGSTDE